MTKITCICKRCLHEWIPKSLEDMPKICPKCKSKKWNEANNIKPLLNIPPRGRVISEAEYLAARKTIETWDAENGGPGTVEHAIELLKKIEQDAQP